MNKFIKRMVLTPAIVLSLITGGLVQAANPAEAAGQEAILGAAHGVFTTKNNKAQAAIVAVGLFCTLPELVPVF
jgi:hypothetical protein